MINWHAHEVMHHIQRASARHANRAPGGRTAGLAGHMGSSITYSTVPESLSSPGSRGTLQCNHFLKTNNCFSALGTG